jgi:3-oxoacyl-[acyl-carrier protein] reductase
MKILITGASKGIGLAEALFLNKQGHELFLVGSTKESFTGKGMEKQHLYSCDLRNQTELNEFFSQIERDTESLDVLVNNVGVYLLKKFEETTDEEIGNTLDVNLKSHMLITKHLLPVLLLSENPQIVFMSSMAAKYQVNGESIYSATKGAITNFASVLRNEYKSKIKVSTIHSWGVNTFDYSGPDTLLQPENIAEALDFIITRERNFCVESIDLSNINQWRGSEAPWSPK